MATEDFKKKLHSILNEDYDMKKFDLQEDSEPKQDFIFSDSTGKSYNVQVEKDENEFYVYDQNGKKLDIFQLDMLDLDGGISKELRKEIVNHYRQNVSKEEVVAEMVAPNIKNIKPEIQPEEPKSVKIVKPVTVVKEMVADKLKPFTEVPKTTNSLEDIPIQFNAIIDGKKHEIYSSAADVYFNFYPGDSGSMGSHDRRTGDLIHPGSPSYPDEYEIVAISVGGNPKDDGYIVNLEGDSSDDIELAKLPHQVDVEPLMDKAAHNKLEEYLATYQEKEMYEVEDIKKKFRDEYGKRGNAVYYATANKQHRNPETFKKLEEEKKD